MRIPYHNERACCSVMTWLFWRSDIDTERGTITKNFINAKDKHLAHRLSLPTVNYENKKLEKFKNAEIMSCLELKQLKLPKFKQFTMKSIFMSAMDELEIKKKLQQRNQPKGVAVETPVISQVNTNDKNNETINNEINNEITVDDMDRIEFEKNVIFEKFIDIIVDEMPEGDVPIRPEFDMKINIKPDSKPIKRNTGRRSPNEHNKLVEEAKKLLKLELINRFNFEIIYIKGEKNVIADMLSRNTSFTLEWDEEFLSKVNSIVYGFEPRSPLNINTNYNLDFAESMVLFRKIAQDNMLDAQIDQSIQYNKTREDITYEIGDLVLVKRDKLNTYKVEIKEELKLLPRYCGPFTVIEKRSKLNYVLKIINNKSGNRIVHVDDIKPFIEEDRILFSKRKDNNFKPLEDEIEKIINKRNRKYGSGSRIEYKIRLKNSNEDHDRWVPQHYLDEVPDMLKSFEKELEKTVPVENNFLKQRDKI
ncbi:hypothetical protein RB653_006847 [Dictyostelium firmibasis]|uniref:Chromo domain-containing protein n=1 Tax=Dictyostelium firmibasis TaxID=79012 RepID=A0AAN7TUJ0_9MYCE